MPLGSRREFGLVSWRKSRAVSASVVSSKKALGSNPSCFHASCIRLCGAGRLGLLEALAVAVHLQDVDVMRGAMERDRQAF
jgi:hypothetical protein